MFSCDQCSFTAPTENRLRVHVKERHDKIKDQVCKICGFAFSRKKDLHRHMVCVHKVGEKKFKCELCPIKFIEAHRLREHVRGVHDKIKDYVCEGCGYATWQKNTLRLHKRTIQCQKRSKKIKCEFKCESCTFETYFTSDACFAMTATSPGSSLPVNALITMPKID